LKVDGANVGSAVALTTSGSIAANSAETTFSYTFTTAGAHIITASYSGDAVYSANTGSLSVTAAATSTEGQSFTLSAANVSIAPGATGTSAITLTPAGAFAGTVSFTVSSPANLANVCFSTIPSATISGAAPVSATLTVDSNDRSCQTASAHQTLRARANGDQRGPEIEAGSLVFSFTLLGVPAFRRRRAIWLAAVLAIGLSLGLVGCGGSSSSTPAAAPTTASTAPGTYTITVTGTDSTANLTTSTSFALTIQ
jgi:hypothetical protein